MKEKIACDILIKNTSYLDENYQVQENASIVIADGKILKIFTNKTKQENIDVTNAKNDFEAMFAPEEVIDGENLLWMPGPVDGHMHTGQQLLKGAVLDELPMIWTRIMLPFESTLTPEKMSLSAGLAALEMIKNGTTGFVDAGSYYMENAAQVYEKSGLRGALSHSSMDQGNFPDSIRQTTREVLETEDRLFERFHGKGNLKIFYSLRALMNCSQDLIEKTAARAAEKNTFFQAHMNEYAGEVNYTLEKYKMRPVEYLDSIHALDNRFIAAHGIMLSPQERALLAQKGGKVVHCPFSNCGKGVPDTPDLLERGICVGLGTDGTAHGGLSLWNEMKIFRSVMNAFWGVKNADPAVMPAQKILKIATENGAAVIGEEKSGVLKEGYNADMISINWNQIHLLATSNKVNTLLECVCGNDVQDSVVGGRMLMRKGQVLTLDEEKIMWQAKRYFACGEVMD